MFDFITSQIFLYLVFFLVLFVPGVFLILATGIFKHFSKPELSIISFASSIAIMNFLMILLGKSPFAINRPNLLITFAIFFAVCFAFYFWKHKKNPSKVSLFSQIPKTQIPKKETLLVVILLLLTIFIKTVYLKDAIFPTATDLGHHMFWAKKIAVTGELPIYEEAEIGKNLTIEEPAPIADFIIGEHLTFAAIAIISGADFFSSFPVLTLFLIHLAAIFAIFLLARSFFSGENSFFRNKVPIITLLLLGPIYSLASPQAKFVSGGVIGNDIGNLFIPVMILLYLKALREKKSSVLALALFMSLGLAYTHHLSTFVFIFLSAFTVLVYTAFNFKTILRDALSWMKMIATKEFLFIFIAGIVFIFFIYTPTYLNVSAVDTAVGTPIKATRTGLTLDQFKSTVGEARFAFAFLGLIMIFFARSIEKYSKAFIIGWAMILTIMSLRPNWLFIDIPSNRVASYIVFPASIISAYMFVLISKTIQLRARKENYLNSTLVFCSFFVLLAFIFTNGFYDNAISLNSTSSSSPALQTYAASKYVASNINNEDVVLKDHNYLSGDAWIKLFFMRDYNFPFSRGFFKRYQDETKPREQCTNLMISNPNSPLAQQCFEGTDTNFMMVDPKIDSAQFRRMNEFWQVYSADDITVFFKKN